LTDGNEESYTDGNKCWYCHVRLDTRQEFAKHLVENHPDSAAMRSHSKRLAEDAYSG